MAQLMTIVSFDHREPAEKLAEQLRDAGFQAEVVDESGEQKWQLFNLHPRAHMKVQVHKDEADRALQTLDGWDKTDGALALAVHCPECRSTRIEYPQFSRRTLMGALPAALAAAGVIERDFYCEACHFTWPIEQTPTPDLDALWWSKGKPVVKGLE
jgi:hypothetical protein